MKIFDPNDRGFKPRADMYLPVFLKGFGYFLDAVGIVLGAVAIATQLWGLFVVTAITLPLGIAAYLCWKNQTVRILDEETFEYSTFLGNKKIYKFSEIKSLRTNSDSMTLFVGDGTVHIEAMAIISKEFTDKIDAALDKLNG